MRRIASERGGEKNDADRREQERSKMIDDLIATAEIYLDGTTLTLIFALRNAEEPERAESALSEYEGGRVRVEKQVAAGQIVLHVNRADATRHEDW